MNILDFFVPTTIPEDVLQCTTISDQEYKAEWTSFTCDKNMCCEVTVMFCYDGNGFSLIFPRKSQSPENPADLCRNKQNIAHQNTVIVNYSQMSTYIK